MEIFNQYSEYYDLFYEDKDYQGETIYLDQLIRKYNPGAKSILDLGCGTGEHDFLLAQKEYSITGVDQSDFMLSLAQNKLSEINNNISERITFKNHDIRTLRLEKTYDVVISMFHVMSYQQTNKDLKCAFTTAYKHLEPGGIFIFDCWYGPGVLEDPPIERIKKVENSSVVVTRIARPVFRRHENQVEVNYYLAVFDKKSRQKREFIESHTMRYLFKPEVEYFLNNIGLEMISFSEFMRESVPARGEWNACFIGRKNSL